MYPYKLHDHQLKHVKVIKYLGVSISQDLSWDAHVNNTVSKANRTLGFLRQNLSVGNTKIKQQAYMSLVRPGLEYASTIWNPYTETLKNKLEKHALYAHTKAT